MTFRGVAAVAVLSAVSLGCRKPPAAAPAPPPAPVTVSQPIAREITDVRDFTGRIEAVESVEIRARVRGFLQKIQFKEGSEVKKGDALFDIDPRTFEADLAKAKADVTRQEAQVRLTTAEVDWVSRARATGAVAEEEYQQRLLRGD